ncbi:MAG: DUF4142 domain-containing protein, partial [Polyangiales bacterium]
GGAGGARAGAGGRRGSPTDRSTTTPPIAGAGGSGTAGGRAAGSGAAGSGIAGGGAAGSGVAGSVATAGTGGAPAVGALTDPQIVAALGAANESEVEVNTIAVTKAIVPSVREYAQELVRAHTAAQQRLVAAATSASIVPVETSYSTNLRVAASEEVARLNAASTTDFETGYLQGQITQHTEVLRLIDGTLLRDAQNPALRAELSSTRAEVAGHLQLARTLADQLDLDVDAGIVSDTDAGI